MGRRKIYTDEELAEHKRQYQKKYYKRTIEQRRAYKRKRYQENKEVQLARQKAWLDNNRDYWNAYMRGYRKKLKEESKEEK